MMAEAHRITRGGDIHFIYLADFNASPTEVRESGWPDRLQATVVTAGTDEEPTCQMGDHASCIDFAIVSTTLAPLIRGFEVDWAVPWAPHAALRLTISRPAKQERKMTLRKPSAIPHPQGRPTLLTHKATHSHQGTTKPTKPDSTARQRPQRP